MSKRVRLLLGAAAAAILLFIPGAALAHEGQPPASHDVWQAWNWEPLTAAMLLIGGVLYGRGVHVLWREAGPGRGIRLWRAAAFAGGMLALIVALLSPLEAMASALFSAHMVQHLLLLVVAPPLLLLSRADVAILWALPAGRRRELARWVRQQPVLRGVWQVLSKPPVVWLLYALTLWIWHLPALYQAALRNEAIHVLEHATFFGVALLLWWTLAHCHIRGSSRSYGAGILLVFTTALHGGLLGWLLTFTSQLWYPIYAEPALLWDLAPLEDQQLAGAIMWAPVGIVYALAALVLMAAWLRGLERMSPGGARTVDDRRRTVNDGPRTVDRNGFIEV